MHVYHSLLALLLAVVLRASAQTSPIVITPPASILECEQTTFTWGGGDSPYSFYYGAGLAGFGNDEGVETETLVKSEIIGLAIVFYAPSSGLCLISVNQHFACIVDIFLSEDLPWRFRVADATQSATICEIIFRLVVSRVLMHETGMYIQTSDSCENPGVSRRSSRMPYSPTNALIQSLHPPLPRLSQHRLHPAPLTSPRPSAPPGVIAHPPHFIATVPPLVCPLGVPHNQNLPFQRR